MGYGGSHYDKILDQIGQEREYIQEQHIEEMQVEDHETNIKHDHTLTLLTDNLGIVLTILGFALLGAAGLFKERIREWLR